MATFGGHSLAMLKNAHPQLVRVMNAAILRTDFMVIQSTRTRQQQTDDLIKGTSKAAYGQSAHDFLPSLAVDCAPLPLDWNNIASFSALAAIVLDCAAKLSVPITWGGCGTDGWEKIRDYPHFELTKWRELAKQHG